jgi:uncharacterized DUF497 family protein
MRQNGEQVIIKLRKLFFHYCLFCLPLTGLILLLSEESQAMKFSLLLIIPPLGSTFLLFLDNKKRLTFSAEGVGFKDSKLIFWSDLKVQVLPKIKLSSKRMIISSLTSKKAHLITVNRFNEDSMLYLVEKYCPEGHDLHLALTDYEKGTFCLFYS